jgi:acyl-CoA synthetase (AMP-forming)/AMP-acid ligase II
MNLSDYIDRGARIAPDAPCMVHVDGSTLNTHTEFGQLTHRIAVALHADGLMSGDRVAVYSPNDANAFACVVGVVRAGGVWTAVNAKSVPAEIGEFLSAVGCTRLIYHASLTDQLPDLLHRVPTIKSVVAIGRGREGDPTLDEWMAPSGSQWVEHPDPTDIAMLAPTGGTTGAPKAVPLTHRQLVLMCLAHNAHLSEGGPPRYICATPMTHAAGLAAFPVLAEGGKVIVHQGVSAVEIFESIERNAVTRIFLPPTALYALLAHPRVRSTDFSSLRHFLLAAAPVAPERLAEAVEVFGPVMTQVFGQAEAPFICTVLTADEVAEAAANPEHRGRLASCGRPSLVARVEIMDDDGRLLGHGEQGEIVVKSDLVFDGYWNNPEASAEVRRPGGWHGTGDVGYRDHDGYIYILDRKKEMIITGGYNVFPAEVEAVIHTISAVNDCAVIGVPDDKWGESVTAFIELKPGESIDETEVIATCKDALGSVKSPKSVQFRELPRSPVGKVLRRELRSEYWAHLNRKV